MSILSNKHRGGNFSSSEIYNLMEVDKSGNDFGVPAKTYIRNKNAERRFGMFLNNETSSREISWGNLNEDRVFNLLGLEYTLTSQETDVHPTIPFWCGSKDGTREIAERTVIDIKAPFTRSSFYGLVLPLYLGFEGIEAMKCVRNGFKYNNEQFPAHKDGDKFYWQGVSNCIINNCNFFELIIYMPYASELADIYNSAKDNPTCKWMDYVGENEIPYIPDNGYFRNINVIRFEVPQEDKDRLTTIILKAGTMLVERPNKTLTNKN